MARVDLTADVLGDGDEGEMVSSSQPVAPPVPAPEPERSDKRFKFTMLVNAEDDERAQRLTAAVVELAGIRPTKGMRADVVRAMWAVAVDDARLQQKIAKLLRQQCATASK